MTPEEKVQSEVQLLRDEIAQLRAEMNLRLGVNSERVGKDIFKKRVNFATTDIDRAINLSGDSQTISVLAYPSGFWEVEIEGRRYNIPHYYAS